MRARPGASRQGGESSQGNFAARSQVLYGRAAVNRIGFHEILEGALTFQFQGVKFQGRISG